MSVVRNPYSRLLSKYRFKFWVKQPHLAIDSELREKFPGFPELSLEQYLDFSDYLVKQKLDSWRIQPELGQQSLVFLRMYYANLPYIFALLEAHKMAEVVDSVASVQFLRQEDLACELIAFLKPFGLSNTGENIILEMEPANVTLGNKEQGLELTAVQRTRIRQSEWLIFDVLKNNGIDYPG